MRSSGSRSVKVQVLLPKQKRDTVVVPRLPVFGNRVGRSQRQIVSSWLLVPVICRSNFSSSTSISRRSWRNVASSRVMRTACLADTASTRALGDPAFAVADFFLLACEEHLALTRYCQCPASVPCIELA